MIELVGTGSIIDRGCCTTGAATRNATRRTNVRFPRSARTERKITRGAWDVASLTAGGEAVCAFAESGVMDDPAVTTIAA